MGNKDIFNVILKWVVIYCASILLIQLCHPLIIDFTKYFQGFNPEFIFNRIIWLIICFSVGIFCYSKRIISLKVASLVIAVYGTLRFIDGLHPGWYFIKYGSIYYLDIFVGSLFISFIINKFCMINKLKDQIKEQERDIGNEENESSAIKSDSSITCKEDDRFEFYEEAELFLYKLEEQKKSYQDNALIVGLEGEWGSGKSSFINMIECAISGSNKNSRFKLVKFSSWNYRNSNQLTIELLSAISEAIGVKEVTKAIDKYINVFEGTSFQWLAKFTRVFCGGDKTTLEYFNDVNEKLRNRTQTLIIAVDDIDRLVKEEVLEVLKLVRNTANFRNIVYVVAYDRRYVEETLKEYGISDSEKYLEKIFNVPFLLPEKSLERRKTLYKEILQKNILFNKTDKTDSGIVAFVDEFGEYMTIRNIKKLAKQLRINTPFVREDGLIFELDIYDTLILYYLSIKYEKIYVKLRGFSYGIRNLGAGRQELIYCSGECISINILNDNNKKSDIEFYAKDKIAPIVGEKDADIVTQLIKGLFGFGDKRYDKTGYCISNPNVYPIFFTKKIPEDYVKMTDFIYESKKPSFPQKLKEWNDNKNRSMLGGVISSIRYDDYSKEEFINMFKVVISIITIEECWLKYSTRPPLNKTISVIPGVDCRYNWESTNYNTTVKSIIENSAYNETFSQRFSLLIQGDTFNHIYKKSVNSYIGICEKYLDVYLSHENKFDKFNYDFWGMIMFLYDLTQNTDDLSRMQEKCKMHILQHIDSFAKNWSHEMNNDYLSCIFSIPLMISPNFNGGWKDNFFKFIEIHKDEIGEKNMNVFYDNKLLRNE